MLRVEDLFWPNVLNWATSDYSCIELEKFRGRQGASRKSSVIKLLRGLVESMSNLTTKCL